MKKRIKIIIGVISLIFISIYGIIKYEANVLPEVFKVFGDGTRIKILWNLFDNEICVAELSDRIKMSQSAVSHQLRILKQARLIKARRDGKNTFYSLDDEHVKRIVEQVMIHITE